MKELELKYGCNPNQKPAKIFMPDSGDLPLRVLNGRPGYINFLDALNSWQLVRELKAATGLPAAASFKHVSPAGAALGYELADWERKIYFVSADAALSPIACAYIRARGSDRLCSYGDWAALSEPCDAATFAVGVECERQREQKRVDRHPPPRRPRRRHARKHRRKSPARKERKRQKRGEEDERAEDHGNERKSKAAGGTPCEALCLTASR